VGRVQIHFKLKSDPIQGAWTASAQMEIDQAELIRAAAACVRFEALVLGGVP
jgi:hypothetical protein